jgi:DNA-binding IscR family transcriptional regulator
MTIACRASDERLLDWLALRARGVTCDRIAARDGVSPSYVRSVTSRIMRESAE